VESFEALFLVVAFQSTWDPVIAKLLACFTIAFQLASKRPSCFTGARYDQDYPWFCARPPFSRSVPFLGDIHILVFTLSYVCPVVICCWFREKAPFIPAEGDRDPCTGTGRLRAESGTGQHTTAPEGKDTSTVISVKYSVPVEKN
jgi:hypothetical protein